MDPVTSLLVGHASGKLLDVFAGQFRSNVIERWSRRRAEEFFLAFTRQVVAERNLLTDAEVELGLAAILEDEIRTEILFDAYRWVALSRSRKLGPRIIALLTAKLVAAARLAHEDEETMFAVAGTLNDEELRAFVTFFDEAQTDVSCHREDGLEWCLGDETFDSSWRTTDYRSTGQVNLAEHYGLWAQRLLSLGVLTQDTREREFAYKEDSERYIDEPGVVREVSWWCRLPRAFFELAELIRRADWSEADAGPGP